MPQPLRIKIPKVFAPLAEPHRYKSFYGGRGGAKSWAFARMLIGLASSRKMRILCTREYQSSIRESVHQLLKKQIWLMGLQKDFDIQQSVIKSKTGSEFIFMGLKMHPMEIKSTEGVDVCWVEEAQSVSDESWEILIPTIREVNSEIWASWNTGDESDPTYQRFVKNPPEDCVSIKVGWQDNPYFPEVLNKERLWMLETDPEAYDHVWDGNPRKISEAVIFRNKYVVDEFEAPEGTRLYYGADWGFSNDPTTLIRCYIDNNELYIDYEAYGVGVELTEIPQLFSAVPGHKEWPIRSDNSRPETISYLKREWKLRTESCDKWPGSVEDGIEFLRKFKKIHIHQRCKHTAEEFKLYSYKTDPKTKEVLPIIVDKHNHCIDPIRYALDSLIRNTGIDWLAVVGE